MHPGTHFFIFLLTLFTGLGSCAPKIVDAPENLPPFSELASRCQKWMTGSFLHERSSDNQPARLLHQCAIWTSDTSGLWIYSETIQTGRQEKTVDQVVYRIKDDIAGGLLLELHALPGDPGRFSGAWRDPDAFNQLAPFELTLLGSCDLHLKRMPDGSLEGGTSGTDCASTRSGATHQTEELTLGPMEIKRWRRGFDASGAQVWGSKDGPLVFARSNAAARPESIKPGSDHVPDIGPYTPKQ